MLLRHANDDSGEFSSDIATILAEATGQQPVRKLWISSVIFAELRPRSFKSSAKFADVRALAQYIRSIATVVNPEPNMMLRVARLRDIVWKKSQPMANEKPRCMTLGDAIHLVSALWVKEATKIEDLEFLTFDNKSDISVETDPGTKSLPLLRIDDYAHGLADDLDVAAVLRLPIIPPALKQRYIDFTK